MQVKKHIPRYPNPLIFAFLNFKSHYLQNPNFSLFTWIFGVLETLKSGLINYRDRKKNRFSKIIFFRHPWRRTASRALGYQYVLFEKYRIYDGSLEVRVGRRLTPKSGEEHAAAEGKLMEREEPLPSRDG